MEQDKIFETDPFPGNPTILFIGLAESSHTHSWIDLLAAAELNVRLFAMPTGCVPPADWQIRTYLPALSYPAGLDPTKRQCLHPTVEERRKAEEERQRAEEERQRAEEERRKAEEERQKAEQRSLFLRLKRQFLEGIVVHPVQEGSIVTLKKWLFVLALLPIAVVFRLWKAATATQCSENTVSEIIPDKAVQPGAQRLQPKASSPEDWLAQIIREWQPDIIHTLGIYDNQGGEFFYRVWQQFNLENYGKWVLQLRGGSDLTLRRHDPEIASQIARMLNACDQIITDNVVNLQYAEQMGISSEKFARIIPVPGTGGIDVDHLASMWNTYPVRRERIIVWPKAYECPWSKALPVLEAIRLAWKEIQPCELYITAVIQEEFSMWFRTLPEEIRCHCSLFGRIPRQELLNLMVRARVLLIPSLVDGIPNSLYEAMACGVFPIVSPLETISTVVHDETNVLFARNLYPREIAEALVRAMNDDVLVDQAAHKNLEFVRRIADRKTLTRKVVAYYQTLADDGGK